MIVDWKYWKSYKFKCHVTSWHSIENEKKSAPFFFRLQTIFFFRIFIDITKWESQLQRWQKCNFYRKVCMKSNECLKDDKRWAKMSWSWNVIAQTKKCWLQSWSIFTLAICLFPVLDYRFFFFLVSWMITFFCVSVCAPLPQYSAKVNIENRIRYISIYAIKEPVARKWLWFWYSSSCTVIVQFICGTKNETDIQ